MTNTIDLDKLEQVVEGSRAWSETIGEAAWYDGRDLFDATGNQIPEPDAAYIAAAKPAVVAELIRQIRVLKKLGEALHHVCAPLGLMAGADLTKEARPAVDELVRRLRAAESPPAADDVEWIVNDMGELGVRVRGGHYFCYKGKSLVYETGLHDDGRPILHRNVGKREFGETVWPTKWVTDGKREDRYRQDLIYTPGLSFGSPDDPKYKWLPLPAAQGASHD